MADFNGLNYKVFLNSLDFDEKRIEKYFHTIIESLEKEVSLAKDIKNQRIEEIYKVYQENLLLYDKVKEDILSKYFDEYREINENYYLSLAKVENEYISNEEKLLDIIDQEKNLIASIKRDMLIDFYEKKKDAQHRIREINLRIDEEYEKHANIIITAKEKIAQNNEFYINAEKHIKELDNSISFFTEFSEFNKEFLTIKESNPLSINTNSLSVYSTYIDKEIEKIKETSSLINKYDVLNTTFTNIFIELDTRIDVLSKDYDEIKRDIKDRLESYEYEVDSVNRYFSNDEDNTETKNEILKEISKKKERLIITSSFDADLIEKEKENIRLFKDAVSKLNEELSSSYSNEIKTNIDNLVELLSSLKELINDEINGINYFKEESRDSKDILIYLRKRFNTLELNKHSESLKLYRDYLVKLVDDNRELDCLAFEILTSEELLKIKLLDLKRELLTINDKIEISIIEYDSSIKEIEETWPQTHVILDKKAELDLIKHDCEIDKDILKYELENQVFLLDLRKDIDILRCDYMIAYARLENVQKIIDAVSENDPNIVKIESQIALERIIELTLLDFSGKKNENDTSIVTYTEGIESLDSETNQRIRYLNNVLEIERNNFEAKKAKLISTTKELRKAIYPALIKNKRQAGEKLKRLRKETNRIKKEIEENNKNDIVIFENVKNELDKVYEEYKNFLYSILENAFNEGNSFSSSIHVFVKNILNTYKEFEESINNATSPLAYKDIRKYHANQTELMDTIDKLTNMIIESTYTNNSKFETKSYQSLDKQLKSTSNEVDSILKEVRPLNEKEINEILDSKEKEYKEQIANIAIENTLKSTPQLDEIDKIDEAADNVRKGYESDIANFKNQYLSTMDTIKREYQERYDNLTALKEKAIVFNESIDLSISNRVNDAYNEITTKLNENIKQIKETSNSQKVIANEMVDVLSNDIQEKNETIAEQTKNIKDENAKYRDELSKKAIEYYNNIELIIKNNELSLSRLTNEKLAYRKYYIQSLNENAAEFKKAYFDKRYKLINDSEENILDKTLEFTDKYNKIKDNSYKSLEQIEKPISRFIENSESLSDNIISRATDTTKDYTNSARKSLDEFKDELDKIIDKYS